MNVGWLEIVVLNPWATSQKVPNVLAVSDSLREGLCPASKYGCRVKIRAASDTEWVWMIWSCLLKDRKTEKGRPDEYEGHVEEAET